MNLRNGKWSYAIYADMGTMGEGSIALADNLGIWSDARRGGESDGILYLVFPGSGNLQPRVIDEIQSEAEKLLQDWGGIEMLASCAENQFNSAPMDDWNIPVFPTTHPTAGAIEGTTLKKNDDRGCRYSPPQPPLSDRSPIPPY